MIFVDSNVPMYIVGAPYPNKDRLKQLLEDFIGKRTRFATDVETYQEILHRYTGIGRIDAIGAAFTCLEGIVDETWTYDVTDLRTAHTLLLRTGGLSARAALHLATMRRNGVERILSFDRGFDVVPGVERLS